MKRQSTDGQVTRCIRDNFRDLSVAEVSGVRVDGLALAEQFARDERAQREDPDNAPKMGKYYMEECRHKHSLARKASSALVVADRIIEINQRLVEGSPPLSNARLTSASSQVGSRPSRL